MTRCHNGYAASVGQLFDVMPKNVIAAVAISFAARIGGELGADTVKMVLDEWRVLFDNGIVKQPPPATDRKLPK